MTVYRVIKRICAAALVGWALSGCATTGAGSTRDPLQPLNRAIFNFNETFDEVLLKPVAEGYRTVVPQVVRTGVTNFFSNIEDVWIAANNLLQGKPVAAMQDLVRVAVNTVFGLGGLIDIAYDEGLDKHNEDFGQTLGRWGIGSGPYLVLPFLGPSTLRDGVSLLAVDNAVEPVWNIDHVPTRNSLYAGRAVNARSGFLDAGQVMEDAALDKYRFVRDSYLQRRRSLVYDGDPPRESEADAASAAPPEPDTRATRAQARSRHRAVKAVESVDRFDQTFAAPPGDVSAYSRSGTGVLPASPVGAGAASGGAHLLP